VITSKMIGVGVKIDERWARIRSRDVWVLWEGGEFIPVPVGV